MGKHIIPIEEAESVVKKYFSGDEDFTTAFTALAKTTWLMDTRVGVCPRDNIIGVSRSDSHFYFYISQSGDNYYIKFKNREKEAFDTCKIEVFKDYCREAAIYIITNPSCILSESKPLYEPDKYASEDKILEESQELLKSLGRMWLPADLLGMRAYNALAGAGIQTCGALAGKSAQDLLRIEGFGKTSLRATCIALQVLAHKEASEYENGIKTAPNNDNEALIGIRERTIALLAEQEARPLCDSDESRDVALNFLKDFSVIIENLIRNAQLITERSTGILCARVFSKRSLADIARDYDLSRERIRQICKKSTNRVKGKISRYKIPDEYADAISNLISDIDDELYLDCLQMVRENDEFLWDVLSSIVSDKENRTLLKDFLERCKKISSTVIQDSNPRVERKIEQKKTYREWQEEDPNIVLLVKSGYFYGSVKNFV